MSLNNDPAALVVLDIKVAIFELVRFFCITTEFGRKNVLKVQLPLLQKTRVRMLENIAKSHPESRRVSANK
ncbi:hypothetical protein D3C87_1431820 [compost metagenome]